MARVARVASVSREGAMVESLGWKVGLDMVWSGQVRGPGAFGTLLVTRRKRAETQRRSVGGRKDRATVHTDGP